MLLLYGFNASFMTELDDTGAVAAADIVRTPRERLLFRTDFLDNESEYKEE